MIFVMFLYVVEKTSQDFFGLGVKFKQKKHILRLKTANVFQENQKEEVFLGLN